MKIILLALLLTACDTMVDKTYPVNCLNLSHMTFAQGTYHSNGGSPFIIAQDRNGINIVINEKNSSDWFCALKEDEHATPINQA